MQDMSSIQLPDGSVVEVAPECCPAGHPLLPRGTLVGWSPCDRTPGVHGHRTYTCRYPVNGRECGLVLSFPRCRDPSAGALVVGLITLRSACYRCDDSESASADKVGDRVVARRVAPAGLSETLPQLTGRLPTRSQRNVDAGGR